MADGKLRGLARGLAWRLSENGGVVDRTEVAADVAALSVTERRMLKGLGVRFGAYTLFLSALLTADALSFTAAFAAVGARGWALSGRGLRPVGDAALPVLALEKLDNLLRAANFTLTDQALADLGWERKEAERILRALGHFTARSPRDGAPAVWRRRAAPKAPPASVNAASPFAALAALSPTPHRKPRRRRKKAAP